MWFLKISQKSEKNTSVAQQPTNCLSEFSDYFVRLARKRLRKLLFYRAPPVAASVKIQSFEKCKSFSFICNVKSLFFGNDGFKNNSITM